MLKINVKVLFLITSFFFVNICFSQTTDDTLSKALNEFKTDRDAKFGVYKIVQYSGLSPNFRVIQDTEVNNAIAYVKGKKTLYSIQPFIYEKSK